MKSIIVGRFAPALALLAAVACNPGQPASAAAEAAPSQPSPPPDLAGTRSAYDFLANRAHALVHRDGRLVIEAGDPSFLKFVDGGWKSSWILGAKDAGKPVAFVSGLSSTFFVPVDTDGDGIGGRALADVQLRLTMRAMVPKQRLTVFVNEKPVGTLEVSDAQAPHDLTIPAAGLTAGENRVRLQFRAAGPVAGNRRSAAAIARIELGPPATAPADGALTVGEVALGDRKRAFTLAGPSRLSFYVQVPAGAKLAVAYGAGAPGTTAVVRVARDGAAPVTVFEGPAPTRFTEAAWDLGAHAGEVVRLDLVARGGGISWATPRLVVKAAAPAPLAKRPKLEHIFVWMVDTLRADKLRVYNPKTVVETPTYDAFAASATRFAWAHVPGTWSLPSHASILTGVYPSVHKATAHEARLSREVPFVAELMKKAGYRTGMFSSNGYVSGKWGFDRGWDINRNFIRESLPNGAEYLWKTAKDWILPNGNKAQFLYLATVEPHVIYNPKKEFLARYWKKPYKGPIKPAMTGIQLGHIKSGKLKINDVDKAYLEALHDAEITQSDAAFKVFLDDLKKAGLYEKSAVVVVSDHGDEFWEHGDVGHAQSVHQELVHIPLIIHAPGIFPAGKVVEADVEAMDVFPTLLDLAGIPIPADTQGASLVDLARDELAHSPRVALSQNLGMTRGIKTGRFRFIHAGAKMELYDDVKDPLEKDDLIGKRPIALRHVRNVFGLIVAYESQWRKRSWGTAANLTEAFYAARP
jgi:arylsulfatase A-like enzyme